MQPDNTESDVPTTQKDIAPVDAAVLIVIDFEQELPRYLMGLRNAELVFMPSKFVFPGGRVDEQDFEVSTKSVLPERCTRLLLQRNESFSTPEQVQALALAAIRETFEETGVLIGAKEAVKAEGSSEVWNEYFNHGLSPDLSQLRFCARAITPAKRIRRYDTRFFCVSAEHIAKRVDFEPGELDEIRWLSFEETQSFDLAKITKVILNEVHKGIANGEIMSGQHKAPFFYTKNENFVIDTLS